MAAKGVHSHSWQQRQPLPKKWQHPFSFLQSFKHQICDSSSSLSRKVHQMFHLCFHQITSSLSSAWNTRRKSQVTLLWLQCEGSLVLQKYSSEPLLKTQRKLRRPCEDARMATLADVPGADASIFTIHSLSMKRAAWLRQDRRVSQLTAWGEECPTLTWLALVRAY